MVHARVVHVQARLLYCIAEVGTRHGQVLKAADEAAILGSISYWTAGVGGEFGMCVDWRGHRTSVNHVGTVEELLIVLLL